MTMRDEGVDLGYEDPDMDESLQETDLGYDRSVPSSIDLGYGEDSQGHFPQAGKAKTGVRAVQIRNLRGGRRRPQAPPLQPQHHHHHCHQKHPGHYLYTTRSAQDDSEEEDEDSSVDYDSDSDDNDSFYSEIQEESMTEITVDYYTEQEQETMANACHKYGVSSVTMEFQNDAPLPRRVSLQFTQQTENANGFIRRRSGHLEVSVGTSRLPRRGTFDGVVTTATSSSSPTASSTHGSGSRAGVNRNNSGLSISTTPMRRISMDMRIAHSSHGETSTSHNTSSTTSTTTHTTNTRRRITMDLSSKQSRRGSLEFYHSQHNNPNTSTTNPNTTTTNPPRRNSRVTLDDRDPRAAMTHTSLFVALSQSTTRRLSMDYSKPTDSTQELRRVSMNLIKSPLPRTKPLPKDTLHPVQRKPSIGDDSSGSTSTTTDEEEDDITSASLEGPSPPRSPAQCTRTLITTARSA